MITPDTFTWVRKRLKHHVTPGSSPKMCPSSSKRCILELVWTEEKEIMEQAIIPAGANNAKNKQKNGKVANQMSNN